MDLGISSGLLVEKIEIGRFVGQLSSKVIWPELPERVERYCPRDTKCEESMASEPIR